jgi:hypothetical protein
MAQRDLIISFLVPDTLPERILSKFRDRPLVINCPVQQNPVVVGSKSYLGGRDGYRQWLSERVYQRKVIPGIFRSAPGYQSGDTIGRVAVFGFSNGCIGPDELMNYDDGFEPDCIMAFDGIHGAYQNPSTKKLNPDWYKNWYNFGARVAQQDPADPKSQVCVITHSSIVPNFPSTTETANLIWQMAMSKMGSFQPQREFCPDNCIPRQRLLRLGSIKYIPCPGPPIEGCCEGTCYTSAGGAGADKPVTFAGLDDGWYVKNIANNFHVFGWQNKGANGYPDHVFQAKRVLPAMAGEFILRRWGGECGIGPVSGMGIFGAEDLPSGCELPQGSVYGQGEPKKDYFPEVRNPMFYIPGTGPIHQVPLPDGRLPDLVAPAVNTSGSSSFPLVSVVTGLSGLAAGYFGARYFLRDKKHV